MRGLDASGLTLRQRLALPALRLGPQLLDIQEGFVTSLRGVHGDEVRGICHVSCGIRTTRSEMIS